MVAKKKKKSAKKSKATRKKTKGKKKKTKTSKKTKKKVATKKKPAPKVPKKKASKKKKSTALRSTTPCPLVPVLKQEPKDILPPGPEGLYGPSSMGTSSMSQGEDAMESVDGEGAVDGEGQGQEDFSSGPKLAEEYNTDDEFGESDGGDFVYGWGHNDAFDRPEDVEEKMGQEDEDERYARGLDREEENDGEP